jgi:hypothetical protein
MRIPRWFAPFLFSTLAACESLSKLTEGTVVVVIEDDASDEAEVGTTDSADPDSGLLDTGMPSSWPPPAPQVIYMEDVEGDSAVIQDFVLHDATYSDGDVLLSHIYGPGLSGTNAGIACSFPLHDLSLGGSFSSNSANWCVMGESSYDMLGVRVLMNSSWVVMDGQLITNSHGDAHAGKVYVFARSTLDALASPTEPAQILSANLADFMFEGVAERSRLRGLYLDSDLLYLADDASGTSPTGDPSSQVFSVDLATLTSSGGAVLPIETTGTVVIDQGFTNLPNDDMVKCEDPTTGNVTWATGSPGEDAVSLWTQSSGVTTWTHVGDFIAPDTSQMGESVYCWDDTDGDGFRDILATGATHDTTFLVPTGITYASEMTYWLHRRWQVDPYSSFERAGEDLGFVSDYAGERWLVVGGTAYSHAPDGVQTGAIYLTPESGLVDVPSDHTHAGEQAAVPSYVVYGSFARGNFGARVFAAGDLVFISHEGADVTEIASMADIVAAVR